MTVPRLFASQHLWGIIETVTKPQMGRPLSLAKSPTLELPAVADACLGYLAENPDELLAFMQHTGLDPQSLRAAIGTKRLQTGLVDYFAANEPILLTFCANAGMRPESFMALWYKLNPNG